jgi:hypothetical protein
MADRVRMPHITVTIGPQTRVYVPLVTTALSTLGTAGTVMSADRPRANRRRGRASDRQTAGDIAPEGTGANKD